MSDELVVVLVFVIWAVSVIAIIFWLPGALAGFLGWRKTPIVRRDDPRLIFRLVHREDRAAYKRIMRRTLAVQTRDMNRAIAKFGREIGKAILPPIQAAVDALSRMLSR